MKVLVYTITRAESPDRGRLLANTLTQGRATAGMPFHWRVYVNGGSIAKGIAESALATKIIDSVVFHPANVGQHVPTNGALQSAQDEGYDYVVRTDDDVEWQSKRWLAKLVEASQKLNDQMVLSPLVRGLRWQPPQSQQVEVEGVPIKIIEGPIGGICRLTPVSLLKSKPYVSDVRLPMGGGDASGVGMWATKVTPITPLAYCQHIRVRHAKTTDVQEVDDPKHFLNHRLFQHVPYIPTWRHENTNDS